MRPATNMPLDTVIALDIAFAMLAGAIRDHLPELSAAVARNIRNAAEIPQESLPTPSAKAVRSHLLQYAALLDTPPTH